MRVVLADEKASLLEKDSQNQQVERERERERERANDKDIMPFMKLMMPGFNSDYDIITIGLIICQFIP